MERFLHPSCLNVEPHWQTEMFAVSQQVPCWHTHSASACVLLRRSESYSPDPGHTFHSSACFAQRSTAATTTSGTSGSGIAPYLTMFWMIYCYANATCGQPYLPSITRSWLLTVAGSKEAAIYSARTLPYPQCGLPSQRSVNAPARRKPVKEIRRKMLLTAWGFKLFSQALCVQWVEEKSFLISWFCLQ